MEMRIVSTSMGISYQTKFNNIGISAATGLQLETRIGKCTTIYVISKPLAIGAGTSGVFGITVLTTDWFTVNVPKSETVLSSLDHAFIQLELSAAISKVDVKLTVYDKNDHPYFSFEKINVPAKALSTSSFRLRGRVKRASTRYKITIPKNRKP